MNRSERRAAQPLVLALGALLALAGTACHPHKHAALDPTASAEPDRVLFEKSLEDIENKRFEVARLTLQTLINAYPDSDYLDRAKLAIADSWFEQGGTAGLTQAEIEYKDFITFFPNSPHTAYAQYRAALCNYRRLEKPDRDRTYTRRAEKEFQLLLKNFPASEYAADGALKLKEVQELLAESDYRVARFYFIKRSHMAASARLEELIAKYPNYSRRDEAVWMAARSFEKMALPNPERAALYYALLVAEHPLSGNVEEARMQLAARGKPIPEPSPEVIARAQKEKELLAQYEQGLLERMFGIFSADPHVLRAHAMQGPPVLDTDQRKPPPPSPEEIEAQRQILVARMAAKNPNVAKNKAEENPPEPEKKEPEPNEEKESPKKKSFWRSLIPFW